MCFFRNDTLKAITTGSFVLILLAILMFWARFLSELMPSQARKIVISPSGLVPKPIEDDPNLHMKSRIKLSSKFEPVTALGIPKYFLERLPGGKLSSVFDHSYSDERNNSVYYFDKTAGLIIYSGTHVKRMPDKSTEVMHSNYYIGPDGISEIPGEELGRFIDPMPHRARLIFDRKLRRFFSVDFNKMKVKKGPEIPPDDKHNPVQIQYLEKNAGLNPAKLNINIQAPSKLIRVPDEKDPNQTKQQMKSMIQMATWTSPYDLVLDESGRIDLLDKETLRFAGSAGHLILPESLYQDHETLYATPQDLLSYKILSVGIVKGLRDIEHRGICVATISREGSAMALAIFDKNAKLIKLKHSRFPDNHRHNGKPSAKAVYYDRPWAPFWTIVKYSIENIHPPLLNLASYFTADMIEANAGYRAMFLLPNSFIAIKARGNDEEPLTRFFEALIIIAPGLALAGFFAWLINRDAVRFGLSENARLAWILAAAAFGLAAYITYRLTRPKITLVTCTNCGKQRRPDREKCHRCSSKWMIPELTPPTWRVIDH